LHLHDQGAPAELANIFSDQLELIDAARGEGDIGAVLGQGEGGRTTNPAATTGYEGHFVIQSESIENRHGSILAPECVEGLGSLLRISKKT